VARILIIDDQAGEARLAARLLGAAGHAMLAADAPGAPAAARAQLPALVLCGLGAAALAPLARAFKAEPALARIPLVALAAAADLAALRAAGIDGWIGTPIEPDSLAAEVEAFLPQPGTEPLLLLVDDDPFMLDLLEGLLAPQGYRILRAGSGEEARALLAREPVQLILCDQQMPGMSGTELLAHARRHHPQAVRIILSAARDTADIAQALRSGDAERYCPKPWAGTQLAEILREAAALPRERTRL
jgi:two-component system, cell cycle response regulator